MKYNSLLTESRMTLLKLLSQEHLSPTELAERTKTSIANVSQQLRLMEAYNIVKREKRANNNQTVGKPKTTYSIAKEINEITNISKSTCEQKSLELDCIQKAILNLWLALKPEDSFYLEKFLLPNDDILNKCMAIGISRINHDSIELLLVTADEYLKEIREKYSNQEIKNNEGKTKKIICWTHTMEEIERGLKTKENHFVSLILGVRDFMDKKDYLNRIREIQNGK